jgi:hypothetical protein
MSKRSTNQKGAQRHAEGQHGDKTRDALQKQNQSAARASDNADNVDTTDADVYGVPHPGHHRLDEGREQHDEAEMGSEITKQERH